MAVTFGTNDGVWQLAEDTARRTGLAGKEVSHVATRNGVTPDPPRQLRSMQKLVKVRD